MRTCNGITTYPDALISFAQFQYFRKRSPVFDVYSKKLAFRIIDVTDMIVDLQ